MKKFKKQMIRILSLCSATCFVLGACAESAKTAQNNVLNGETGTYAEKTNGSIKTNQEDFYDENVIYQLPDSVALNTDISVIVTMNTKSLVKTYLSAEKEDTVSDFIKSKEGKQTSKEIETERKNLIKKLKKSGVDYTLGEQYDTVLSGFEITIKAKDFDTVSELFKNDAQLIVGEVYEPAITEVVTNEVDVHETGIFTGLDDYKGDGVVVAVLDTGLDYTHSAFLPENSPEMGIKEDVAFELDDIKGILADKKMVAETSTSGLTANDVYLNKKVPYMYDYADKDPDVMPINSEHGTHVAGIIAGQDNTITGVAPNAQLAIMKVFSDTQAGARTSWILAALEDCVNLGVDVINMSLGSGCGFARESDDDVSTTYDKTINEVYDSVRDAGISLIAAAANDYTSTMNSEKNGSLSLTSNPDFGTVGSPSTYAAALSVASVDGVQTPYLKYGNEIIYFNEASTSDGKPRNFVDGLLNNYEAQTGIKTDTQEFEYITIPGIGRESDYMSDIDYTGKIVLVKRGTTTFEEKVRIALKVMGATGIIIYNNVSGMISMAVGDNVGPVCSIAQDEGEMLAANPTGTIVISRNNTAGPFMSEFSSWGPTSDLQIKPEITAHGGEILSAVPGSGYERLSGTSMAAPNQAGAAALIRQYVRYSGQFGDNYEELTTSEACEVTAIVNQLMMSTADTLNNKNGLPYAVRKQGAGLINLQKATTTEAYLTTFDKTGALMDKAKIELGDDKTKSGAYTMELAINNISASTVAYNVDSIMLTEGVAKTYTGHDEQTVTQEGYLLNPTTTVKEVNGVAATSNTVTVGAKQTVKIKVEIVLSAADKEYLDESFANGMYVEGFIKLEAQGDTKVNLSVPVLAFYGDWTQAPIFDEEYYDTNKDELNEGLNHEDKVMADAYATRVLGGLYSDYITSLGTYYFKQDPKATPIAANKEHIAISNQYDDTDEEGKGNRSTVNSIHSIYAGLLRNCREVNISIVEDSTGEEIFYRSEKMVRKSAYRGGGIGASAIDVEFSSIEHNLKNNTKYTVTVTAYIDYGENADQKNERNTFTFPLYIDFQAPAVTDVRYRSEYDRTTKKTKLFADIDIYDNHYAMAMQLGQITEADKNSEYTYEMDTFGKYFTPIYSSYNSTSTVTVELTDYIDRLKDSVGSVYDEEGKNHIAYNNNSFIAICYDYAMNSATYEIRLPDEILTAAFTEEEIQLTVGRTKDLTSIMSIYPSESWVQTLDFVSENPAVASVVNNVVVGKGEGETVINAVKRDANNNETIVASIPITVAPGSGFGSMEVVNKFELTGYYTNKAYYSVSSDEREIGETDSTNAFGKDGAKLSMYPSESVTIEYTLDSYYPDETKVVMESMNEDIAIIREMKDGDGNPIIDPKTGEIKLEIVAQAKGNTDISIDVYQLVDGEWEMTMTSESVSIEVKDPFTVSGMYLMSYKGLGGVVEIPADRGITAIYQYAFSNYEYIPKDENDEINEEDPFYIKPWYIGEDTITKVIIPEGVTAIESYAFANLTALEEVVLPQSLVRIGVGAFTGCVKLKKINLEYAKFINEEAFKDCPLISVKLDSAVSIGNYTFQNTKISALTLPVSSQSLGIGAFADNEELRTLTFRAPKMKIGSYAFSNCPNLNNVVINAAVIASYAFYDCVKLESVTIGKDVAVIGEFAFTGTNVSQFAVEDGGVISLDTENSANLLKDNELILVAPKGATLNYVIGENVTSIAAGAFAGNTKIQNVTASNVEVVGEYAFAECLNLKSVDMPNVKTVGDYAFAGTSLTAMPDSEVLTEIGAYAFAGTLLTEITIMPDANVGEYAFGGFVVMESGKRVNRYTTETLAKVTIGNGAEIGEGAFNAPIYMATYENIESLYYYKPYTYYLQDKDGNYISEDGEIVANKADAKQYTYYTYDFSKAGAGIAPSILKEVYIGEEVTIGRNSFSGNAKLQKLEIGSGTTVGDFAFMNSAFYDENVLQEVDLSGVVSIGEYAFSGTSLYDYQVIETESKTEEAPKEFIVNAYKLVYVHGEDGEEGKEKITHYQTTKFAPIFKSADISGATYIGEGAFAYNEKLQEVIFSDRLEEIPAYAFALCSSLAKADLTASIKTINEYAFYLTALSGESVDLRNVETIGEAAFASSKLTKVTFKDGAVIGDSAFKDCELLTGVDVSKVKEIGAEAFYGTSLTSADLTSATIVGDFAFGESKVTSVKLGANIEDLGENPFYACAIATYGTTEDVYFNGEKLESQSKPVETYNVNDTVFVINGVLYQKVKAGLELISYPMNKVGKAYTVEEGTTRITARALAGSMLEDVTFPTTLMAVGDKALYDCENLSVVVFKSYFAPVLEEDYDQSRISYDNLAMTGTIGEYEGIGIVKYYMWNSTANYTNFYFGANFVDFIGDIDKHVIMVKPANGRNYSTFIFSQYFGTVVEGSNAATEETISVISLINLLPEEISLSDEAAIVAARAAYDKIMTLEQKSLVGNYNKLTSAESTLEYLKSRVEKPDEPETPPTEKPDEPEAPPTEEPKDGNTGYVIAIVALSVATVGLAGYFVCDKFIFSKKTKKGEEKSEE